MRIAIACLMLMLMAGPVMACSYPMYDPPHYAEKLANNDRIFFGQVIERKYDHIIFKVISSRGKPAVGEHVRVDFRLPSQYCDSQPRNISVGDLWIYAGQFEMGHSFSLMPEDLGEENGQDFEKLLQRVSDRIDRYSYRYSTFRKLQTIAPQNDGPLFASGSYTSSQSCPSDSTKATYTVNVSGISASNRNLFHKVEITTCEQTKSCSLNERAALHDDGTLFLRPIGQTACSLTLTQTAEGVTVVENDPAACATALNCQIPNGFNTSAPLQPTADTLRMRQEQNNRVRGNNSFMPTPLPPPQPKAE